MSKEVEFVELINKQQNSYEKIKALQSNYKKDSVSRKSIDYLNKRIETLQSLWDEFLSNHEILMKYESVKRDHDYFKNNIFNITRSMFNETKKSMTELRIEVLTEPGFSGISTPKNPGTSGTSPSDATIGQRLLADETKKLLRHQMCNFNALNRAVTKINLNEMKEKWQFQDQLNILQSKWESIDKIHWELSYLQQGDDKDYEARFYHWEEVYDNLKAELNRKIFETSHYEKSTPRIELPEFNGTYSNWISFRDLFFEMVHDNPTLNKTQKMKFLKSKLRGEAEKLIKHLPVSAENYDSCLDIIQHRYDNKRLLFTSYIDTLLNQPSIDKANSNNLKKLHDTTKECLNALENIKIDIPVWGPLIVHLLSSKLDDETYGDYIQNMKQSRELPSLNEFMEFLEIRFMSLEIARTKKGIQKQNSTNIPQKNYSNYKSTNFNNAEKSTKTYHATLRKCPLCINDHVLWQCPTFLDSDVATRNQTIQKINVCKNCLCHHGKYKCNSTKRCRTCNCKHHTLLHDDNLRGQQPRSSTLTTAERTSNHINGEQEILLTTLQLKVKNREGDYVMLRALLDQGSQVTLITENAAQRLNLPRNKMNAAITGVGSIMGASKGMIKLECKSIHSEYTFQTEALVMRKLINNLPSSTINAKNWSHLDNIKLADPAFNISGPIDVLLGAEIYSEVILEGMIKRDTNSPVAQQTKLGWILCGATKQFNCLVTLKEIEDFSRFWETEEIPSAPEITSKDEYCEKYYTETTERLKNGRYVVKMPMKANFEQNLGNSKSQAIAQFLQLEKKMARQEHFAKLYKLFINDYIDLGHMKKITETTSKVQAYLPHHGVLKDSSTTTKLRAVFNASMKTDSGYSLNDLMEKGPNLQKDILSLIIKWRSYKYVLTADIEKMYRQILIHQDQQCLQRIFWRESVNEPLREMQLCTLTYGTKVAPFIAMRTLQQLAKDEGSAFPLAQKALQNEAYMDDVTTGHHNIETTKLLQKQLNELLKKGGFTLRKWATNEPSILKELQNIEKSHSKDFNFKQHEFSKILGLAWDYASDTFHFISEAFNENINSLYTKRRLLSEISKIYDPLGWLAPMTIQAKLIFQKLWSENYQNIGWDENVPESITNEWIKIKSELPNINNITLPRWIRNENNEPIELQAFCDASEQAYACVIYGRTTSPSGAFETTLLAAKTKVAPLKNKSTIPRLELSAAVLLANLLERIKKVLADYDLRISCWTDSKVVLAWLQGNQTKYEKYITNRTTHIINIVPAINWGYVKGNENPADCATRGLSPSKLVNFSLWWEGPQWLKKQEKRTRLSTETYTTNEGFLSNCYTTNATEPVANKNKNELINTLLERYSSIDRITRILAWVIRFADALQNKQRSNECNELNMKEINNALCLIIKSIQGHYFENEIKYLSKNGKLPKRCTILKLNPFLDSKGVLRVGGRLKHSYLPEETKYPTLIPREGRLTQLIIEKAHQQTLHGGARLTLAYSRNKYWIISDNRTIKKQLRQCIRCRRYATTRTEQLMGNLPTERITPSKPFSHTGVDFTGHVEVKINKGRGIKTCKGYIAIFICMCTKAVHIELVSDLSTQTFIAALRRMCARRGTPTHIYSDNGNIQLIQKMKTNEQYLLQLIRNQTLIIEAENNVIKKNEDFVKTQMETIQRYMNETKHDMSILINRFHIMKTMDDVNSGALTASLLLSVLRRNQQMLLDTLTDLYRGNLDIKLFTPEQFSEQLNHISSIISKRLTLPIKKIDAANIHNIYKLIYVKARLTEQYLLFELHIPLLSDDEYALYRNIPITIQHTSNQCQRITTTTEYIGVNFAKNTYIQMEEADLHQCTIMMAGSYICHTYTPINSMHGAAASCEAKMLGQNVNIVCDWISQQCSDQWIKLQRPNIWLYNCVNECPTHIICENQITTTMLTKAGLLSLGQDCVIQHNDVTMYSHNIFSSKTNTGITLEIPTVDSPNDMWDTYNSTNIMLPKRNLADDHRLLDTRIAAQKERESLPSDLSTHDIGNYTISSLLVGGIIVAIIVWQVRRCGPACTKSKNTAINKTPTRTLNRTENIELKEIATYAEIGLGQSENNPQPPPEAGARFKL